jgi:hypothetical protein
MNTFDWNTTIFIDFDNKTYAYNYKKNIFYLQKKKHYLRELIECFCCCNFLDDTGVYFVKVNNVSENLKKETELQLKKN